MKLVSEEYKKLIDENIEVSGAARVRAEWNWNNTQYLSAPARNGVKMKVIDNSGLYKSVAATVGEAINKDFDRDFFKQCFDIEYNNKLNGIKEFVEIDGVPALDEQGNPVKNPSFSEPFKGPFFHSAPSWKQGENQPKFGLEKHFSVITEFYLDIAEEGWYLYKIEADDRYEVYMFDEQLKAPNLAVADYEAGDYWYKPEVRNGYIATYFGAPGRFYVKALLQNVDLEAAFLMSYSSPRTRRENNEHTFSSRPTEEMMKYYKYTNLLSEHVVFPDDEGPLTNPEVVGLPRVLEKNTYFDEESQAIKYARNDVHEWDKWREYFPTSSLTLPHRPKSGINYNIVEGNIAGNVSSEQDFINQPLMPKKPRYYGLSTKYPGYTYWISDCKSDPQPFNDVYMIPLVDLVVRYSEPLPSNKIRVVFNLGVMPKDFRILYSAEDNGDSWLEAGTNHSCSINKFTGEIEIWRQPSGLWTSDPYFETDTSDYIKRLRLIVLSVEEPNRRVEVVELGARKHIDITESVESFSLDSNMNETSQFNIMGTSSANSGSIDLSDLDRRFSFDHVSDIRRNYFKGIETSASNLQTVVERQTKFTIDAIYKDKSGKFNHEIRIGTMYATDWEDSDSGFKLKLFDSAKYLQNKSAPDVAFENKPIHYIIGCLLDLVGFSDYSLDMSDFKKNQLPSGEEEIKTPVMAFFTTDPNESVWKALQEVCDATYSAVYFDEYGTLQLITKDEITRSLQRDEETRQTIEPIDHTLRGQKVGNQQANIIEFSKNREDEANAVNIKFKPKKIKESNDPYNPQRLTDILWQSDKTVTLQAARLVKTMGLNEEKEFWIDSHAERATLWPYSGRGNINGEIVAWNGKEYQWIEYVWEKYTDVIINVTIVPKLIRPEFAIFQKWIDNAAGAAYGSVAAIPSELAFLGFKLDLGRLKNWLNNIIRVSKESGESLINEPQEIVTELFAKSGIDGKNEMDRVLISRIVRKEWIYSETERQKRNENTGRGNAIERSLNKFTGRIRLVPKTKISKGRAADDSGFRAEHSHLPKDGWYAKKITEHKAGMSDGYWSGREGSEDTLSWVPVLSVQDNVFGDGFQTAIETRRTMDQALSSNKLAALMRTANKPAKTLGFRFRFHREQAKFGEIGFIFGVTKATAYNYLPGYGPASGAGAAKIPSNMNEANQYYKLIIKESSDGYNRARTNEVDAHILTPDRRFIDYDIIGSKNHVSGSSSQLRNMNVFERDATVRYRGYAYPIERMKWYDVEVSLVNDGLFTVSINGQTVGSFTAPPGVKLTDVRIPFSPHYGVYVKPGTHAQFDYIWSWSEEGGLISGNEYSRYDISKGQYVSSFLENNILVPSEENRVYRSTNGRKGDFFFDDFGSVVHEIRDFDVPLDKGPGLSATYYVSNPSVKMFDTAYLPNRAKFSLVNMSSHLVVANGDETVADNKTVKNTILIYGYKIMEESEKTLLRTNAAAIKDRGEVKEELDAKWISSDEEAVELANWIMQHFSDIKDTVSIEVFPDASYSIGDRVKIIYDEKNIDPEWIYIVNGIRWQFAPKGFTCSLTVRRVRNNNIEYFDIDDPEFGIKKDEVHLADSRDTGAMSEGGVTGLTLYGPTIPNAEGKPPSNIASENPTWKSRYPIAGFLFDTITSMGVDILGKVAVGALSAAAAQHGIPPQIVAIGGSLITQTIHGVADMIFSDENRYGM